MTIKDYVVVKTTYSDNTSNNTHRDDINRITDVTGNVLTVDSALSHDYLPTTHPVYIVKLKPTTKTKFENFRIIHKKHPTNRNHRRNNTSLQSSKELDLRLQCNTRTNKNRIPETS